MRIGAGFVILTIYSLLWLSIPFNTHDCLQDHIRWDELFYILMILAFIWISILLVAFNAKGNSKQTWGLKRVVGYAILILLSIYFGRFIFFARQDFGNAGLDNLIFAFFVFGIPWFVLMLVDSKRK